MGMPAVNVALLDDTRVKNGLQAFSACVVVESYDRTHPDVSLG